MKIPAHFWKFLTVTACFVSSQVILAQGPPQPPPLTQLTARPAPAGNAVTTEKTHLGKALFWDEQLSSTRTISCGSCHQFSAGGSDPRSELGVIASTHPGPDGILGNADDITGSPGVVANQADGKYLFDDFFGMAAQVTGRYAPSVVNAGFPNELFWDGRANQEFRDPITDAIVLANGAALESQAAGPPGSPVEMAHGNRDWTEIAERIAGSKPLALAINVPADLETFFGGRNYPALFEDAFGDSEVTAARIIMAIATYERTLVSNQAPFDDFIANVTGALTGAEERGRQIFIGQGRCVVCHGGNRLTNDQFRYIGVRPQDEDIGREAVTGDVNDRGRMKVPTLRNVALKNDFMHNGRFVSLADVVAFYNRGGDFSAANKDPNIIPLGLNDGQQADLVAFLSRPLTDVRLVNETAPFNPPTLFAESVNQASLGSVAVAGTGGISPIIVAIEPPLKGNPNFTIGVAKGLAGATATLIVDDAMIGAGAIPAADDVIFRFDVVLDGTDGFGSVPFAIPADADFNGATLHAKWFIADGSAANGLAETQTATFTIFGESAGDVTAPINVTASDAISESEIAVSWDAVTGAESYQIFRDDSLAGLSATNSFTDSSVTAGAAFSYKIVAVTKNEASPKSAADTGSTSASTPATPIPTNISATDGTNATKVSVSWNAVTGATGYVVFRGTTNSSAAASQIGTTSTVSYDDTKGAAGTLYFYFVKATDTNGTSEFSVSDSGFRGIESPENLSASDGTGAVKVALSWDAVAGATSYTVYRGPDNEFANASELTTTASNSLSDTIATPAVIYTYWVTASANGIESGESNADTGYRGLGAVSNFTASNGLTDQIALNWNPVTGAVNYLITRSTSDSPSGPDSSFLELQSGMTFSDTMTEVGTTYNYWIEARGNNGIASQQIGPVSGLRVDVPGKVIKTPGDIATAPAETNAFYDETVKGSYWGLLKDSSVPDGEVALLGYAGASITHNRRTGTGGASLTVIYDGRRYRLRASVNAAGTISRTFSKFDTDRTEMMLALQLVDTDNGGKLVGTLSDDGATTDFEMCHREYHARFNPASEIAGRYTLILPSDPDADAATIPGGDGIAAGVITKSGTARFGTRLGDGSLATISMIVSPDHELMFYRTLYRGTMRGFIGGKMTIRDVADVSDADGILQWTRGEYLRATRYPSGFDLQQPAVASRYTLLNTREGQRILEQFSDAVPNVGLALEGGNFENGDIGETEVEFTTRNRISHIADPIRIGATTNVGSGLVSGRYRDLETRQNIPFYGAAFQKQGIISGNFPGVGQTGYFRIEPKIATE